MISIRLGQSVPVFIIIHMLVVSDSAEMTTESLLDLPPPIDEAPLEVIGWTWDDLAVKLSFEGVCDSVNRSPDKVVKAVLDNGRTLTPCEYFPKVGKLVTCPVSLRIENATLTCALLDESAGERACSECSIVMSSAELISRKLNTAFVVGMSLLAMVCGRRQIR